MERVSTIIGQADTEVLKEPRGFIKFIQIVIAICAFACAVSNSSRTGFTFECHETNVTGSRMLPYYYPFNLDYSTKFQRPLCGSVEKEMTGSCYGDFSNFSQFFVFVGVTAFLLCVATLLFYILVADKYHRVEFIPALDFVITILYSALWFISSSAWADGVVKIKHYTDPSNLFLDNPRNKLNLPECFTPQVSCAPDPTQPAAYANLNFSIIFGYLCFFVWAGNVWFLYKETKWYKNKHPDNNGVDNFPSNNPPSI